MAKIVMCSVFIVIVVFIPGIRAGTVAFQNRDTTLDDLKSIDSYVSGAIPVLQDGFFIGTSQGPVLVKSENPKSSDRPKVRAKYYNTLPRLIPAGFEGIATSHFNLGAANPIFPTTPSSSVNVPVVAQPQQYIATQASQVNEQYGTQPILDQSRQVYHPQQYVADPQRIQEYIAQPQQQIIQNDQPQQRHFQSEYPQRQIFQNDQPQQQIFQNDQPQQQIFQEGQPQQQLFQNDQPQPQLFQHDQPQQQLFQHDQPKQQQFQNEQEQQFYQQQQQAQQPQPQYFQQEQPQQQHIQSEQSQQQYYRVDQPQQRFNHHEHHQNFIQPDSSRQQQLFQFPQQFNSPSQQLISERSADSQQAAQEPAQITSSGLQATPVAEPSFQVDNLLRPEQEQSSFQTQIFGRERFQSQKLFPNDAVVATSEFEETLPETLRNRFYKNANLATILAQESLPVQGEQIISEWDTNKIAKGKIHALLRGAGLEDHQSIHNDFTSYRSRTS